MTRIKCRLNSKNGSIDILEGQGRADVVAYWIIRFFYKMEGSDFGLQGIVIAEVTLHDLYTRKIQKYSEVLAYFF